MQRGLLWAWSAISSRHTCGKAVRFQDDLPNERWQSDMTHWSLADESEVEIVNYLDDHSRLCVASVAVAVAKATDVVDIFVSAAWRYGTPASVLTDNGCAAW